MTVHPQGRPLGPLLSDACAPLLLVPLEAGEVGQEDSARQCDKERRSYWSKLVASFWKLPDTLASLLTVWLACTKPWLLLTVEKKKVEQQQIFFLTVVVS